MSIPSQISAARGLAREEHYAGEIAAPMLERLADLQPRQVVADFRLRTDVARQGWLDGHIRAELQLGCRVCLERFSWSLDIRPSLALAMNEEQEERLMAYCEPLLIADDNLLLHQVVEDEILLALPMMPRCPACENRHPLAEPSSPEPAEKPGALAALKDLKLKGESPARRK